MAGRIGFYGLNNNRFVNRFFKGGHSHYFERGGSFMENYWLPLIGNPEYIEIIDKRDKTSYTNIISEKIVSFLGKVKEVIYISIFAFVVYNLF
ncbi:hypothetical protein [Klebsiella oxytoca]